MRTWLALLLLLTASTAYADGNWGSMTTFTTPAGTGDHLVTSDDDVTKRTSQLAFSGTSTTFLNGQGGWATPPGVSIWSGLTGTAWRIAYTDGSGNVTELPLGNSGTYLGSTGTASAPSFSTPSGAGDVSGAGDCVSGDCYDGTSDGGTYVRLYDANSNYTEITPSDTAADVTITTPATTGTLALNNQALDTFGATTDITTGNASITAHGLLMKLDNDDTHFLNGQGNWVDMSTVGDVTGVGDCTGGDCLDGSSDGGSYVRMYGTGGFYTGFQASDSSTVNYQYILPAVPGSNTQVLEMVNNTTGQLGWASPGTGTSYENIGNPAASGTINFGAYTGTYTSSTDGWGGITLSNTASDNASDTNLLTLSVYDNDDANSIFIEAIQDADGTPDTVFKVSGGGDVTADGIITGESFATTTADGSRYHKVVNTSGYTGTALVAGDEGAYNYDQTANRMELWDGTDWNTYFLFDSDVDDIAVDGATTDPISSNWAFDHDADTTAVHGIADTSLLLDTADLGVSVQQYDADTAKTDVAEAVTAAWDFGGAGTLEIPNAASPTAPSVTGQILLDTATLSGTGAQGLVEIYDGTQLAYVVSTTDTPANDEIPKYDSTTGTITWETDAGSGSGAFSDSADPVVLNTTTKDVVIGTGAVNTSKLTVDGDADQVQMTLQGNATQTDSVLIVEDSTGTEVFSVDDDGTVTTVAVNDPTITFDTSDADDTDWYIGQNADQGVSSDDEFEIRTSSTPGSSVAISIEPNGDTAVTGDLSAGGVIIPSGSDPGSTCTVGEIYIDTDETVDTNCTTTADNSLCICTATNTWTALENN